MNSNFFGTSMIVYQKVIIFRDKNTVKSNQQTKVITCKNSFRPYPKKGYKKGIKIRIGNRLSIKQNDRVYQWAIKQWNYIITSMEKRNTLDERFINLRQVFHDFQTSVRFSTSNSPSEIFANQLKSYQFLGELQEHFISQKVQYLYEFVHSIFSLIFTMIREGPSQRNQKPEDCSKKSSTSDIGIQTDESLCEDRKKMPIQGSANPYMRRKKRAALQIEIFQKDITEMSFRQRRRALQKMRDSIYAQDQQPKDQPSAAKQFKPNLDKVSYSKSDQSIKSAIDTFKESDISTHIFLKHFMEEFVEIKDIKSSVELLNKEMILSMSKAVHKYKQVRYKGKGKFRLFSHTIQEIVYPTISEDGYQINIRLSGHEEGTTIEEYDCKRQQDQDNRDAKILRSGELPVFIEITNLEVPKTKLNELTLQSKLKRSRFPSLMSSHTDELNPINETKSHDSFDSTVSPRSIKKTNNKAIRNKFKSSFSQDQFGSALGRSSFLKHSTTNQIPLLLQRTNADTFNQSRTSHKLENSKKQYSSGATQENLKERKKINSKRLRKRNISNFVDKHEEKPFLKPDKLK